MRQIAPIVVVDGETRLGQFACNSKPTDGYHPDPAFPPYEMRTPHYMEYRLWKTENRPSGVSPQTIRETVNKG